MHPAADANRDEDGFLNRGAEVTRAEAFFDAAFAFAITLMVISIDEIPDSAEKLLNALKAVPAFAASFLLIVLFWRAHADWSRHYGLNDRHSQRLSLLLVFLVLVFIYPLRMVFGAFFEWISQGMLPAQLIISDSSEVRLIMIVFASGFGLMGAATLGLYRHAWKQRESLHLDARETLITRYAVLRWLMVVLVSLTSLILSVGLAAAPENVLLVAMPGLVFFALLPIRPLLNRSPRQALEQLD
jgi:uncharacterized membrane protein